MTLVKQIFQNGAHTVLDRGNYYLDPLQTSLVVYEPRFIPENQCHQLFSHFIDLDFQKAHLTRSVIWFGPVDYTYGSAPNSTNLKQRPLESDKFIVYLCEKLGRHLNSKFNSCLVNLYEDETQTIPRHSDDEPMFGVDPVIASLSFGALRKFVVESKSNRSFNAQQHLKSIKSRYVFPLGDGDLLVMKGAMQRFWNHSVPAENSQCGPRINLTFRNVVNI